MSETEFQPPALEELAELLPAYEILAFIAAGGMGAVYQATQKSLDREVAIKILPREFGADEEFRTQFAAEAKAMAKLNHPNLIGVYDFGEVDGMPYLVMEFVNGNSLYYSSYEKAIEQVTAGTIALGIAEGLAHAHKAGILHRDIKPANIFLNSDAEPKIGDFGLARPAESGETEGPIFGTPGYTAPEVTLDPANVGTQADVFSLGVILYELLTGERPDEEAYVPIYRKVQADRRFDQIVQRAIHPSPHERYEHAGEMAEELRRLVDTLGSTPSAKILIPPPQNAASPELLTDPNEAQDDSAATTPTSAKPVSTSAGSWNLMRNLVLILVLAGAAYGVWKAIGHKQDVETQKEKAHLEEEAIKESFENADKESAMPPVAIEEPATPPEETKTPEAPTTPPKPEETTRAALTRLKPALLQGDFSEFPPATISRGTSRYLFIKTPMTWPRASQFALNHRAHLATCSDSSTRGWLSSKLPSNSDAWVGAGTVGKNIWGWVDGSEWELNQFSSSTGSAAALSDLGTVRPHKAGTKLPFLIQWHTDGSNPGTLDKQLERAIAAKDTPNPYWPPGSFHQEKRHFLLVYSYAPRDASAEFAKKWQGHLAVISNSKESEFLTETLNATLPPGAACWLGASRQGEEWKWINQEPWALTAWKSGAPDGDPAIETALRFVSGTDGDSGWDDADPNNKKAAPGFLIEWSTDEQDYLDSLEVPAPNSLIKLREIAKAAFTKQKTEHQKALAKNAKEYRWELDDWFRQLSGNQRDAHQAALDQLKSIVSSDGKIDSQISRTGVSRQIINIFEERLARQNNLEKEFLKNSIKLRTAYLSKLAGELKNAQKATNRDSVRAYEREIEKLGEGGQAANKYFEGLK